MPEVHEYMSGEILFIIKKGFRYFKLLNIPILGSNVEKRILRVLRKAAPTKINVEYAGKLIQGSNICAVGERVCNKLYEEAEFGESVFLDELAKGMVEAGKAKFVDKNDAIQTIDKNRKYPIIITRVSGKYMEICRTLPKQCIYWNSEKHGLKCIKR
jgi:hypothetical protein